jgi:hypothetical protein
MERTEWLASEAVVLNHFQVRHSIRVVYFVTEFVITAFSAFCVDDSSHAVLEGVYISIATLLLVASQRYNLCLLLGAQLSFTIGHTTPHHLDLTVILTPIIHISITPSA